MSDFQFNKKADAGVLTFTGDMTIQCAALAKEAVESALKDVTTLVVDIKGVTGVDLTFLQILCSLRHTAERDGKKVSIKENCPEVFKRVVEEAGFSYYLKCG
jgi:anti-anti-sigma factor